jgi:hypothetical protein
VSRVATRTQAITARIPASHVAQLRSIAEANSSTVSRLVSRCVAESLPHIPVARPSETDHHTMPTGAPGRKVQSTTVVTRPASISPPPSSSGEMGRGV